jgi:8-amino-7-oxononanoate synthase
MNSMDAELEAALDAQEASGLRRTLRRVDSAQGREITLAGRRVLNFSSNDYLGLASHPAVTEASSRAARDFGAGSGASRLISGSLAPHHELEAALAAWKGSPAAITFGSGFAAAVGVIPALVGRSDVVILDRRVHACCVDGARLSGAKLRVCRHNDLTHLEELLRWARGRPGNRRILVITESVFSMDGDQAPVADLVALKDRYGAWLMLDEAHASGLFGNRRSGLAEAAGVAERVEVQMGTLGKAIGAAGGYVCGSRTLIEHLINQARSFIFSTAPVPAAAAGACEGIRRVQGPEGAERCAALWSRIGELAAMCPGLPASSAILPVLVGDERRTMGRSARLLDQGFFVPGIRFPTVARGQARLRISLTAAHHPADVTHLGTALSSPEV